MKIKAKGIKPVTIGRNESGNHEYHDTGHVINYGDKAFMLMNEDTISGAKSKIFFKSEEEAKKFE